MDCDDQHQAFQPRRKSRVWLAAIPAFLLTMGSMGWSILRYTGMLPSMDGFSLAKPKAHGCAAVYGVTLHNSEYYASADAPQAPPGEVRQRELATVVSGMVENKCDEPLRQARILLHVRDSAGKLHVAEAVVQNLGPKQARAFERAMIGQFSSPEAVEIR